MDILQQITHFNSGQTSALAGDCPIFVQAKYLQWLWPQQYEGGQLLLWFRRFISKRCHGQL